MRFFFPTLILSLTLAGPVWARNVDLSTVPQRDSVQLTIYNSEDLTLVRETRTVTFKPGANPLQFSWANTLIDPSSVQLKFLTDPDKLEVLDTTFPHDKPQMLYWNVQSELNGPATIEITYFTSGISWTADYILIGRPDESAVSFEGFVRVQNASGEEYENAQVRLVVGTINLVEKIALLAGISMGDVANLTTARRSELAFEALSETAGAFGGRGGGAAEEMPSEKQIVKEGLSEYFIYTIDGVETINNGWSKRMRSLEAQEVPLKIQYRYRPQEYGEQLVRMYLLTNDKPSKLGETPLPDGVVRVFRDNGRDGLAYLTQQTVKYIPIGDKIELNLGADPEVIFELIKRKVSRDNLWMNINGTSVYRRVDDGAIKIEINSSLSGWSERQLFSQRIRNYTSKPIDVEVRRSLDGHILFRSLLPAVLHDYRTVQFTAHVPAAQRADLPFEVVQLQGYLAKQNNVTLEEAAVE